MHVSWLWNVHWKHTPASWTFIPKYIIFSFVHSIDRMYRKVVVIECLLLSPYFLYSNFLYIAVSVFQGIYFIKEGEDMRQQQLVRISKVASSFTLIFFLLTWANGLSKLLSKRAVRRPSVRPSSFSRRRPLTFCIFNFFFRTAWWILMKLGRDEVLIVPYKCCWFSARSVRGGSRAGQNRSRRVPFFKKLVL